MTATAPDPLRADTRGVRTLAFKAMATDCVVRFRLADDAAARNFALEALGWVQRFESRYSRFREDSIVSRINRSAGAGWVDVDEETERLLEIAADAHRRSEGIVDASMLPLLKVWNWKDAHRSLPDRKQVADALPLCGWDKVGRRRGSIRLPLAGMGLDFGGFGKEHAVDVVAAMAARHGIQDALVDFGRDIFAMGGNGDHPFWHVGVEDGLNPGNCWGGLAISGRAVCSSGDVHRHFTHRGVRYGHILDPRTGWPVANGMRAVTVVAPTCLEAGVYSTTVFVLGAREGIHLSSCARDVEVCAQTTHGIEGSRGFGRWLVRPA